MNDITILIDEGERGERLDTILSKRLSKTRNFIQLLIEDGYVVSSGKRLKKNHRPEAGEEIRVRIPAPEPLNVVPQNIPLDIAYEDNSIIIINKPKGMVVHPAVGNRDGTLVNALLAHCGDGLSGINGKTRPGIVHRLDKDTSGLMVVAKTDFAHNALAKQIKEHSVRREYHAVVIGGFRSDEDTIDAPIGRHRINRKKMCVTQRNSKQAVTHYKVLERFNGYTYISCLLETGRTHQIRVHMSSIGHPLVGDSVYGARDGFKIDGQCLHSKSIELTHPVTEKDISVQSELPEYFNNVLDKLRRMTGGTV